jgi:hypothetical protein
MKVEIHKVFFPPCAKSFYALLGTKNKHSVECHDHEIVTMIIFGKGRGRGGIWTSVYPSHNPHIIAA